MVVQPVANGIPAPIDACRAGAALAGWQHAAHDDFVDLISIDAERVSAALMALAPSSGAAVEKGRPGSRPWYAAPVITIELTRYFRSYAFSANSSASEHPPNLRRAGTNLVELGVTQQPAGR